jgi:hypothetical protein
VNVAAARHDSSDVPAHVEDFIRDEACSGAGKQRVQAAQIISSGRNAPVQSTLVKSVR